MKILTGFLMILGIFEVISNAFHLSKRNKASIGKSARGQHQELPTNISDIDYFYKVMIMFLFGIAFVISSVMLLFEIYLAFVFTWITVVCFGLYGFIQALLYRSEWKVWTAMLVYNVPLILLIVNV